MMLVANAVAKPKKASSGETGVRAMTRACAAKGATSASKLPQFKTQLRPTADAETRRPNSIVHDAHEL